jgi:hypothetical protein
MAAPLRRIQRKGAVTMTTPYTKPEDYDRIPDDELSETEPFRQTHRSYLDMLPYLMSGDPDDPDTDLNDGIFF